MKEIQLIRSAIALNYGPRIGVRVFDQIGITEDRMGLKLGQIEPLREELRKEVSQLLPLDEASFRYVKLMKARTGGIVKGYPMKNFYVVRTHDRELFMGTPGCPWDYTGDKVHISVNPDQIEHAWNSILPILLRHHHTTKQFKIADMKSLEAELGDAKARRVYKGAQIVVYLFASPHDVNAARRFAEVMRSVSSSLKDANIGPGDQPPDDLPVDHYVSFRHDLDDLLNPKEYAKWEEGCWSGGQTFDEYYGYTRTTIRDTDQRYGDHKDRMKKRPLYKELRKKK